MLLEGAKVVIPAGITTLNVTGELLTDDGSSPFDTSLVVGPCIINYKPAEAEVIRVAVGGNEYSLAQIQAAVWGADTSTMTTVGTIGHWVKNKVLTLTGFLSSK